MNADLKLLNFFLSGFLGGSLFSFIFFYVALAEMELPLTTTVILTFLLSTLLPLGIVMSSPVKCVSMLIVPSMFTGEAYRHNVYIK